MDKELRDTIENLGTSFEQFKKTNDQRLSLVEKDRGTAEIEQKLSKIDADLEKLGDLKSQLDQLEKSGNRINNTGNEKDVEEHKSAFFGQFIRKGKEENTQELERKAMNVGTDADGGLAIPEELDREIITLAKDGVSMRRLARSRTVSTANYKKLVQTGGTASGWVGETDARSETGTPAFAPISAYFGEIYANPAATQTSLDDLFFDVKSFLSEEISQEFMDQESQAFLTGNGTNKPKGLLDYATATTNDDTRAFGTFQIIKTGVAGDWAASDKGDIILDVEDILKERYLANAAWLMKRSTRTGVRKLKDADGNYLWQPGLQEGVPALLNGYRVETDGFMPAIGNNANAIAFGDFSRAYTVVDVIGTRMLRDPYTNKPFVHFYTTKRVGGFAENTEAVKFINFAV